MTVFMCRKCGRVMDYDTIYANLVSSADLVPGYRGAIKSVRLPIIECPSCGYWEPNGYWFVGWGEIFTHEEEFITAAIRHYRRDAR